MQDHPPENKHTQPYNIRNLFYYNENRLYNLWHNFYLEYKFLWDWNIKHKGSLIECQPSFLLPSVRLVFHWCDHPFIFSTCRWKLDNFNMTLRRSKIFLGDNQVHSVKKISTQQITLVARKLNNHTIIELAVDKFVVPR